MTGYILRRLAQMLPVLLLASVGVWGMVYAVPGGPAGMILGENATPLQIAALHRELGLDQPILTQYWIWLSGALTGNMGRSIFSHQPVASLIAERLPATLQLGLCSILVGLALGMPVAIISAIRPGSWIDRVLSGWSALALGVPTFWLGILLILLFAVQLGIFPVGGRIPFGAEVPRVTGFLLIDTLWAGRPDAFLRALSHLALPALTLGLPSAALLARVIRSAMAEVLASDYVLFAEAKALSRRRVLFLHALKNALIPAVTVLAIETGSLLGGNMIVETVFGWPGLGRLVVESIFARNYPLVQAAVLLYAVTYVSLNFCADLLYAALNPKVRL